MLGLSGLSRAQVSVALDVSGFDNNKGDLLLAVFNDPSQFPYDPFMEFKWPKDTLNGERMILEISLPITGKYAFSVLDDENSSGDIDKNFIGFPTERFGFSNDARPGWFKPPSYESCIFEIKEEMNVVRIKLQ